MNSDYERIAAAIRFLDQHVDAQPSLDQLAEELGLSPFYLQRLFRRWAGVSPKRFLQFLTVEHAKKILEQSRSVLDAAFATGLSSPSRLHDHFVALEAVTPGEYKARGAGLVIRCGVLPSPFGLAFLAVTQRGVCALAFLAETGAAIREADRLRLFWPDAQVLEDPTATTVLAERIFAPGQAHQQPVNLLVKGTNFQIQVWKALLAIPAGRLCSYEQLARALGKPAAARAVGQAVAANPVAYLIPCHRVIRRVGALGGYHWGAVRKQALIAWEAGLASSMEQEQGDSLLAC